MPTTERAPGTAGQGYSINFRVADPKATQAKLAELSFLAGEPRGQILDRLIDAELDRLRKQTGWPGRAAS